MVRALALAIRLMKKIDRVAVGREARYFWQKLRQRRYDYVISARAEYMIAPHIRLTEPERAAVLAEALQSRQLTWEPMETLLNGTKATIQVNKKWAAIVLGGRVLFLKEYPLQSLSSIDIDEQAPAKP